MDERESTALPAPWGGPPARRAPPGRTLALLGALYFTQGLPFGFQAIALPVYLRQQGVSLAAIGFAGALAVPWMLKVLWAPLVDRYGSARFGRRRSWIVPMQSGLILTCAAAAALPLPSALGPLLALVFLMNLFAATQDIAVDGLAVDLLGPGELGYGNALQVVGYKLGMLTGGGLLVWASARIGWQGLFAAMALLCAGALAVALSFEEPASPAAGGGDDERGRTLRGVVHQLVAALRLPGTGWLLAFVATYKLGETLAEAMFKPFLVDVGYDAPTIGLWVGTYGMVASLIGSLGGGWLATRLPLLKALVAVAALRSVALLGNWALATFGTSGAGIVAVTVGEHLAGGALTTVMFAFMMAQVDRRIGATHYTLLASVEVLGKSPASWASGLLAQALGYAGLFMLAFGLSAGFLGLVIWRPSGHPERRRRAAGP